MLDFIVGIDKQIFVFINQTISNNVMDLVMPIITNKHYFIWPLVAVCLGVILLWKRRGLMIVVWGAILITISDQLSSTVIKALVDRPRPCHELDYYFLLINCGSGASFPSSHAVNVFAAATYFGERFLHRRREFFAVASMVALSRVYCGVHYPFDIIFGAALGIGLGIGVGTLDDYLGQKYSFLSTAKEE
ncbi:MAG: phosphatase PAP2 family protein [candidate division Zixibacteria bacterium]|nr:phosphatase PAP2 family protein [candidate division Zixibacteria bacterium]